MTKSQHISLFALRVALGWLFFWSGINHVLDPKFSAAGYLAGAKTLTGFYHWLASPSILPITNALNEWGLTLIGLSLLLGLCIRISAKLGALMMILYWIPLGKLAVDSHIIYAVSLIALASLDAGRAWGIDGLRARNRVNNARR